jgi:hypothetical protein
VTLADKKVRRLKTQLIIILDSCAILDRLLPKNAERLDSLEGFHAMWHHFSLSSTSGAHVSSFPMQCDKIAFCKVIDNGANLRGVKSHNRRTL